ncbi:MAG: hypothetical protein GY754_13365 [bacterium]|nr:hypothetical protein [bacterium]
MIKRIISSFKFHLERFLLGGVRNQLILAAGLTVLISFIAGYTLHLFYGKSISIADAFWWAFLRMSDPGYLGNDQGIARRVISTIVTLGGYVIFLGLLVAIMTQWLNATMRRLESGLTPITRKGHICILGWTNRTPILVREFLLSEDRANRFLRTIKKSELYIVILTEEFSVSVVNQLKDELGPLWDRRTIVFRQGTPLRIEDLHRVDFLNAGIIVMPGSNFAYGGGEQMDTRIVKSLLTISNYAQQAEKDCPYLVSEIFDLQKYSVIRSAYDGDLEIVPGNILISRLIAQDIRHKGLSYVFSDLLSNEGNEIYLRKFQQFIGSSFGEIKYFFHNSILLGILRKEESEYVSMLNPPRDTIIREDDLLVLLGENQPATEPSNRAYNSSQVSPEQKKLSVPRVKNRLLFIGWNNKVPLLVKELSSNSNDSYSIDVFSIVPIEEREAVFYKYTIDVSNITVNHITGSSIVLPDYNKLDLNSYDAITMLSNDWLPSGEEADARTIMGYMFLKNLLRTVEKKPHLLIELMDRDNAPLFKKSECEIIITPLLISYTISQIALSKGLRIVFDDIFTYGGADIYFHSPGEYSITNKEVSFAEIENAVSAHGETALGLQTGYDTAERNFFLNPEKTSTWLPGEHDKIIVLGTSR